MTSGTAVANALPAMVEAHYSHTPLAVISADRPARMVGTGASQTIEQQGIFGVYAQTTQVESAADVPLIAERFLADRQVHINVALDVPLVGEELPGEPNDVTQHRARTPRWSNHGEVAVDLSLIHI